MGNTPPTPPPHPLPPPPPPPPGSGQLKSVNELGVARTEERPSKTKLMIGSCNENYYHNKQQILRKAKKRKS